MTRRSGRVLAMLVCAALLAPGRPVSGIEGVVLEAGPLSGPGWSLSRIQARLRISEGGRLGATVEAQDVRLPPPFARIERLVASCAAFRVDGHGVSCGDGQLRLGSAGAGAPDWKDARFSAEYRDGEARFELSGSELGGRLTATLQINREAFRFELGLDKFPMARLSRFIDVAGIDLDSQRGTATGALNFITTTENGELTAEMAVNEWAFSNQSGLNAGESIVLELGLEASKRGGPWTFGLDAAFSAGQAYLHPLFVDAADGVLELKARGRFDGKTNRVQVQEFRYRHHGVAEVNGAAVLSLGSEPGIERLALTTEDLVTDRFYGVYVKPWLLQTVFSSLEAEGGIGFSLDWQQGGPSSADVALDDLALSDGRGRFGIGGLDGVLRWRDTAEAAPTRIRFSDARFYRIEIGAAELAGMLSGTRFELQAPLVLPLLEGAAHISAFEAEGLGTGNLSWKMGGELRPISLEALTRTFGWPTFTGSLSGEIPLLRYENQALNVDGTLSMRAFDGRVEINDLTLENPLGVVPRASADVRVSNISLGALTRTFSFGNIEGRLSGRIDGLVLKNWRPAAFDAAFATPEDDTSRHRISQRAVKNLARLGGAGDALSSTVLRFLDTFSYDRLGLSCRLKDGVCQMAGVRDAERGYYIVEGGGLPPRIDVIGYNRRVDWETLVERLKAVTRAGDAQVR